MKTVISMFDDLEDARDCVEDLVDEGFAREDISLIARDVSGEYRQYLEDYEMGREHENGDNVAEATAAGATGGAVLGGLIGLLVGATSLAIPGLGALVVAGPLGGLLAGAATGAVAGGILGALLEWGVPEDEAEYYAEAVRRGGTLVALKVVDARVDDAVAVMEDHDPVDIERRAEYWEAEEDWTGYDVEAEPYSEEDIEDYHERRETWYDEAYGDDDLLDFDDDEYEVPYSELEPRFHKHYDATFATGAYTWTSYVPAYRFGYLLAVDPETRDRGWNELAHDKDVRDEWEAQEEGAWDEFQEAIKHAWKETKGTVNRVLG